MKSNTIKHLESDIHLCKHQINYETEMSPLQRKLTSLEDQLQCATSRMDRVLGLSDSEFRLIVIDQMQEIQDLKYKVQQLENENKKNQPNKTHPGLQSGVALNQQELLHNICYTNDKKSVL